MSEAQRGETGSTTTVIHSNRELRTYQVYDTELDALDEASNLLWVCSLVVGTAFSTGVSLLVSGKQSLGWFLIAVALGVAILGVWKFIQRRGLVKKIREENSPRGVDKTGSPGTRSST